MLKLMVPALWALIMIQGYWDFPSERYNVQDGSSDGVAADLKVAKDLKKGGDKKKPPPDKKVTNKDTGAVKDKTKPPDKFVAKDQKVIKDTAKKPDQKIKPPDQKIKPPDQKITLLDQIIPPDQMPTPDKLVYKDGSVPPDLLPPPDLKPPPDQFVLLGLGAGCTFGGQCASNRCMDSVCCNQPCSGGCKRCYLPGKKGFCSNSPAGQDPDNDCPMDALSTCNRDGLCDGQGGCRKYATGTICGQGGCKAGDPIKIILPSICTMQNKCVNLNKTVGEIDCKEYLCNPVGPACFYPCSSNSQCKSGKKCKGGKCDGKDRPLGATCKNKKECESGECWKKVCCDKKCNGSNETCTQPGAKGRCLSLFDGK